ncbi:hypothetical protein DXC21_05830 [Coprobacillus sp. OM08-19]|jgi:hypothetical protein|uniref:DUF6339 family protein n=1 Tax=Faecalibacillus intestinalis TaxID=1982626 RepID=UPI000E541585|nr:DUF6339 family protein [Faecalibacillus intestinalis]RGI25217.1 hypothetical protein DXC21_05830 [Coprobacillus sp. OM08-19]
MKINIKMMSEEAYLTLQKNYKEVYNLILQHPTDSSWLYDFLGFEPFEEKKYEINDFDLELSDDNENVLLNNGIIIYENLRDLPRYVLCNNRFWAWILFKKAYRQAISSTKMDDPIYIKNLWLGNNSRRSLMLGTISRYFFITEISADNSRNNKYELTELLWNDLFFYRNIAYRNIFMIKNVSIAFLEFYKDFSIQNKETLNRKQIRYLMIDLSKMGSVMLIDVISKDEIYNFLKKRVEKYI